MTRQEINGSGAGLFLTADELLIVCNALNEVCNGLDIAEFATRIGAKREEAARLLESIGRLYDSVVEHREEATSK